MALQPPRLAAKIFSAAFLVFSPALVQATEYDQYNLVSDVPGLAAVTDPNLANPWGVSFTATSPFWISDQAAGVATLYNGAGAITPIVVTVPGGTPPVTGPTGQVANSSTGFLVNVNGTPTASHFIFDTLGGTIDAWASGSAASVVSTIPGAIYTGLAQASVGANTYLYAADSTGQIRVFDSSFNQVTSTTFAGKFTDPNLPAGYVPFNIQSLNGNLYVTYARLTPQGTGLPGGIVDIYSTSGSFISRFSSSGALYAPWGMTLAPSTFGSFGGDILIGNFGNGEINAFDPVTGAFLGALDGENGQPIVNDFLWALDFRTGGTGVDPNALYFTAGIDNQTNGLFGEITLTPEPSSLVLLVLGCVPFAYRRLRGRFA